MMLEISALGVDPKVVNKVIRFLNPRKEEWLDS